MQKGFELLHFVDQKDKVIKFLDHFKIYPESQRRLSSITDPRNLTLGAAKGVVDILHSELGPMLKHLNAYQLFFQAQDLIEFLGKHAEGFETTEQFLNGTVTGNGVMTGLLNSVSQLMHAGALEIFFATLRKSTASPRTFLAFNQALSAGAAILENHLPKLKNQVHEIRVLFDMTAGLSTEKLLPRVEDLMRHGQFESLLMIHANSARLFFRENQTEVPDVQVQSLLKGLAVFLNKVFPVLRKILTVRRRTSMLRRGNW